MFADRTDFLLILIGSIGALLHGASMPLKVVLLGDVLDSLADEESPEVLPAVTEVALLFVYLAIVMQFAAAAQVFEITFTPLYL